jgi:hypothetical protein
MRNTSFILILLVALFLGVLAMIDAAGKDLLQLTTRDQSTGPYNPDLPSEDAIARGA